jgi:hypothetical protein
MTRLGVTTSLDPLDIAALWCARSAPATGTGATRSRPRPAGMARARHCDCRSRCTVCPGGCTWPTLGSGRRPSCAESRLDPAVRPLVAVVVLGERISRKRSFGVALIALGACVVVACHVLDWNASGLLADVLCLFAALLWACFTIVIQQANLDALQAAAIVAVGSSAIYLPIFFLVFGGALGQAPRSDIALQAIFQSVLVSTVALICYGRSVPRSAPQ